METAIFPQQSSRCILKMSCSLRRKDGCLGWEAAKGGFTPEGAAKDGFTPGCEGRRLRLQWIQGCHSLIARMTKPATSLLGGCDCGSLATVASAWGEVLPTEECKKTAL